jgi:hypothetical protein
LVLLNITDIDEVGQRFHDNAYLFMTWQDWRLKYAQTFPQPDATAYPKGEIWSPTVELVNAIDPRQSVDKRMNRKR